MAVVPRQILIVEDDETLAPLLEFTLKEQGYRVSIADSGQKMFDLFLRGGVDLVLLDLTLPDEDGLVLLRQLRARTSVPIIVLTGRRDRDSRLAALEFGADDFVTKPFDPKEFSLRVGNLLERTSRADGHGRKKDSAAIRFEGWTLDLDGRSLWSPQGNEVKLTPGEFAVLSVLAKNPGRAMSRDQLLDAIANNDEPPSPRMIDVHISNLRSKIEPTHHKPALILTVRSHGYKFAGKVG